MNKEKRTIIQLPHSLRDEIAIASLGAMLSNPSVLTPHAFYKITSKGGFSSIVWAAYEIADEVVAERKRREVE